MPPRLGCDIVQLSRFADTVRREGEAFLSRVFLPEESNGSSIERLAGIFAAKEATCKALGIPAGQWHDIHVSYEPNGAPRLTVAIPSGSSPELTLSISHDGDYVVAVVLSSSI
jgi:holo-[acyl-carrier protein] synthase